MKIKTICLCCLILLARVLWAVQPIEAIRACMIPEKLTLSTDDRSSIAQCLEWHVTPSSGICQGSYLESGVTALADPNMMQLDANEVSLMPSGESVFHGQVLLKKQGNQIEANTAYVYRDPKTHVITQVKLVDGVRYTSDEGVMVAQRAIYQPVSQTLKIDHVLYRLTRKRHSALLGGWGRAASAFKDSQNQVWMEQASYTSCSPTDNAWEIKASSLKLDRFHNSGIAKGATVRVRDLPIFYSPYLSFPISKERKSGFLMPTIGSTSMGGVDVSLPYYLNLAPNYDATLTPHLFTKRGLMYGGKVRYLTADSAGELLGNWLPHDAAYSHFLTSYAPQYPFLANQSTNRWEMQWREDRVLWDPNLTFHANTTQVSDDYYLQDFSTNLGVVTERQILREGGLAYHSEHWLLNAEVQSYQTLEPINETPVELIYERLPQLSAQGQYDDLPFNTQFNLASTYDYFHWPSTLIPHQQGSRYHLNPRLAMNLRDTWGYFVPSVQWVGNAYTLSQNDLSVQSQYISLPRVVLDGGLTFERTTTPFKKSYLQTFEPRLYYLNVPFQHQSHLPVFDSAYMIFTAEQVFRDNRFSGFDRIGDANQLGYGLTTRWLDAQTGEERGSILLAQLKYFSNRRVMLCSAPFDHCMEDPLTLGFLSPTALWSPLATHGVYHLTSQWSLVGDYAWDPATRSTNNTLLGFSYQAENNRVLNFGYSYLVNGDITQVAVTRPQQDALNQLRGSFAWSLNDHWSSLGAYSYNVSKQYEMMSLFGVQYDSCCWAVRLMGGRTFRGLNSMAAPQYTNSIFLQILLKGLGAVGNSDPTTVLRTFVPNYRDSFKE